MTINISNCFKQNKMVIHRNLYIWLNKCVRHYINLPTRTGNPKITTCVDENLFFNTLFKNFKLFIWSSRLTINLSGSNIHSSRRGRLVRLFKFTLKPPYSIAHDKLRLAIWDTSFWTVWLKFGHKGP